MVSFTPLQTRQITVYSKSDLAEQTTPVVLQLDRMQASLTGDIWRRVGRVGMSFKCGEFSWQSWASEVQHQTETTWLSRICIHWLFKLAAQGIPVARHRVRCDGHELHRP